MREPSILISASMVRAILEGRKAPTRLAIKGPSGAEFEFEDGWPVAGCTDGEWRRLPSPYGDAGDRL